jgi:hypothetical protein
MGWTTRLLAVLFTVAVPSAGAAAFGCDKAVEVQATWCTSSQITSIPPRQGTAVCTEYTRQLAAQCRADWDQFKSCDEFAARFSRLLVRTCEARKLGKKPCQQWGDAYLVGPLTRCQRGKTAY